MENNNEQWRDKFAEHAGGSRDGYKPVNRDNQNNNGERPHAHRPRISRGYQAPVSHRYDANSDGQRPRYRHEGTYQAGEGGFQSSYRRSSGEGGGYQGRPRYNRSEGYQPRQGYQPREEGYQPRQGYQPREEGYQRREGGYQPRPRFNREGGGYQPRGGFQQRRPGGYNPNAKYSMKKQIEYKEKHYDPDAPIRLNRFLANAGVCSRREADEFIAAGVVSVNGKIVTELGTKVLRTDEVLFHDQKVSMEKKVYVLLNKPKYYVTTSDDPQNRKTVMDLVQGACRERIYPVGRLDRNTTGVLLLTNDGDLASKLTHPQYRKKKIYHVYLDKNFTAVDMHKVAEGIELEDGRIAADAIEYANETDKKQVGIEIHSGRNRIVRRIFEHLGYRVIKLDRVLFAGLTKKNLRRGDWRFLTEKEVNMLYMGAFE